MLDNERYNATLSTIAEAAKEKKIENPNEFFQLLLEEHYKTQLAIAHLENTPDKLTGINQLYTPNIFLGEMGKVGQMVEVLGMPRAGKTTVIAKACKDFGLTMIDEKWEESKKWVLEKYGKPDFIGMRIANLGMKTEKYLSGSLDIESGDPKYTLILDRGWLNALVNLRTNFMYGRITDPEEFKIEREFLELAFQYRPETGIFQNAIIMCLIPPELSYARRDRPEKTGKRTIFEPKFLKTYYEQHLRLYSELLKKDKRYIFTCLDFTKETPDQNQEIFNEALKKIMSIMSVSTNLTTAKTPIE